LEHTDNPILEKYPGNSVSQKLQWLQDKQAQFNSLASTKCSGLLYMKNLSPKGFRSCGQFLCPSCWHKAQLRILQVLGTLKDPIFYLRQTSFVLFDTKIPQEIITRLKAKNSGYSLRAYTTNVTGGELATYNWQSRVDELHYQLRGIFTADKSVTWYRSCDSSVSRLDFTDNQKAIEAYIHELNNPAMYFDHPFATDYFKHLCRPPVGRYWSYPTAGHRSGLYEPDS
jgi:hypothetical protein